MIEFDVLWNNSKGRIYMDGNQGVGISERLVRSKFGIFLVKQTVQTYIYTLEMNLHVKLLSPITIDFQIFLPELKHARDSENMNIFISRFTEVKSLKFWNSEIRRFLLTKKREKKTEGEREWKKWSKLVKQTDRLVIFILDFWNRAR